MAANVNNYINAANAAVKSQIQTRQALANNKARLDNIGMAAVTQDANTRIATAQDNSVMAQAAIIAKTDNELTDYKIEKTKELNDIKKGARKAGMIAGGVGLLASSALMKNRKQDTNEVKDYVSQLTSRLDGDIQSGQAKIDELRKKVNSFDELPPETAPVPQGDQSSVLGETTSLFNQSANITGKYESDSSGGYNAYNLGGSDGGHTAHGSGDSSKDSRFGGSLTSLSIGKIKQLQSQGQLHAAGRFQFIGNSLPEAAQFAGLSDDDLFTPENQNRMYMAFGQKYGSGRWVGLTNATPEELEIVDRSFREWSPITQ